MIGYVSGVMRGAMRGTMVIDTGGVGYRVRVTATTLAKTREEETLALWTYLAVRENAQELFGFETKEELAWFELLLTVSGVGPRSALAILNAVDQETLERAITRNDANALSHAYGIGKKTAEKVVLELKEKVGAVGDKGGISGSDADVVDALVGLGYSAREARDAVRELPKDLEKTEARIREAIRIASHTR
jgi:holliday junction DNA helicase RuvA